MDNASKNAKDVIDSLQIMYNRGRQAAITNELIDDIITSKCIPSPYSPSNYYRIGILTYLPLSLQVPVLIETSVYIVNTEYRYLSHGRCVLDSGLLSVRYDSRSSEPE